MFQKLEFCHAAILAGMAEVEEHCSREIPDLAALALVRVKLSRASTERSKLVRDVIVPKLLENADPAFRGELSLMLEAFTAKRVASSKHVATWSSWTIQQNWDGYREASRTIRKMMQDQIDRERKILSRRLRERGL
ncbi:hypothetical protein ATB93_16325 [Sphingomonas sp. WG]|nr:hypothetical protein ATB93_16325 [Sphingomonas sp. WG]